MRSKRICTQTEIVTCVPAKKAEMYSARSGRKIKPPPDGSVVDILSKYSAEDSDEDSEDEEYTPAVDKAKSVFKRNGF